jgi:hypothetical protein
MAKRKGRGRASCAKHCASRSIKPKSRRSIRPSALRPQQGAELKYGKLHELERQLKAERRGACREDHSNRALIKEEVDEEDIAEPWSAAGRTFR